MTDSLLSLNAVTTQFDLPASTVRAVSDVSFDIRPGRVLGVVGESGSGKSVTARSIMRMVHPPGRTVAGSITYDGTDLLVLKPEGMRRLRGKEIALVFQDPQAALNPVHRVGDQIIEALVVHGTPKNEARARARKLLMQVGIPDVDTKINDFPHQFSGGMRQRVVIAIALANNPRVLIADEPTTALDVTIQAQILRLVADLTRQYDLAVMLITHDMGVVAEMCDDVVVMYGGRVVEKGEIHDVMQHPRHPYTSALLSAMPRLDQPQGLRLPAIPGSPPDPANLPPGCAFHPRCRVALDRCSIERPDLTSQPGAGHQSACFVAAAGDPVAKPRRAQVSEPVPVPSTAGREPLLRITDLRTDVGSRRRGLVGHTPPVFAVDGVSLELYPGETLGLVGESGCGKSTISRTVVGINPVAGGTIEVKGRDVTSQTSEDLRLIRSTVQYVFQDPYASLNPRRTIGQSLHEALEIRGVTGSDAEAEAKALLEQVGLNQRYVERYPHSFSGGQRQRIGIARALASRPEALILDEPVSALDVSIQAQIINLLEDLQAQLNLAFLFIAHDLSVVKHMSDRIAVMYLGRIVETGMAAQVYESPQHPYTAALLSSTPNPDVTERDRERVILSGDLPSVASPPSGCRFRTRCPIGPLHNAGREICITDAPQLQVTPTGQHAACHFTGELIRIGVSDE